MQVWLPFILLPCILAGVLVFFYFFIRHYIEKDKIYFGTLISCASLLSAVTFALLLVPLDVYSVSASSTATGISGLKKLLQISYYIAYVIIILSLLVALPFAYFYYDAYTDYETQRKKRILQSLKYTAFFLLAFGVLIGAAFIIRALNHGEADEDWRKRIVGELTNWEAFIIFLVAVLSAVGLIAYVPYLGYGLSVFPIFLIKGRSNPVTEEREHLLAEEKELKIAQKTQQQSANDRHIQSSSVNGGNTTLSKMAEKYGYHSKHGTTETAFVKKDFKLRDTERRLESNRAKQQALQSESAYWTKCWTCMGPFRFVIGIILLILSILVITQQLLSVIERIVNSSCGWKCGFTPDLKKVSIPNPFDWIFHLIAPAFPLDLILYTILISYLFICILYAVTQLGVRLLTFKLSSITASATPANSLVLAVAFIAFATLSMNSQLLISIPRYSTFGKQTYIEKPEPTPQPDPEPKPNSTIAQVHVQNFIHNNNINNNQYDQEQQIGTKISSFRLKAAKFNALFGTLATPSTIQFNSNEEMNDTIITNNNNNKDVNKDDKEKRLPCDFKHANLDGECRVTQFGAFMQKSNHFLPFISIIQLAATFGLCIFFFIFLIYALCKKPESDRVWQSDDPDGPNYVA